MNPPNVRSAQVAHMPTPACFSPFVYATGYLRLSPQKIAPRRHKDQQDILSSNHFRLVQVARGELELHMVGYGYLRLASSQCVLIPPQAMGEITATRGFFRHALFDLTAIPRKLNRQGWPVEASMQIQPSAADALGRTLPLCLDAKGCRAANMAFSRWSGLIGNESHHALERLAVLCQFLAALQPNTSANDPQELLALARRLPPGERSVDTLAAAAGRSVRSLQRHMHRSTGVTPQMLLNRLRAQELLECMDRGQPLDEIAQRLGYPSTAALAISFRRLHGMSVSAWRTSRKRTL
jgi:AraC-like DNA-binding protein